MTKCRLNLFSNSYHIFALLMISLHYECMHFQIKMSILIEFEIIQFGILNNKQTIEMKTNRLSFILRNIIFDYFPSQ